MAVIMTLFVLTCHHSPEDDIPAHFMIVLTSIIAKLVCWKCRCFKTKTHVVSPNMDKHEERTDDLTQVMEFKDTKTPEVVEVDTEPSVFVFKWQEIALIWDRFFLFLFLLIVATMTTVIITMLLTS